MLSHITEAASVINGGGVVAHATEGVWGFACDPHNPTAVQRILDLKQRPAEKGLLLIAASAADFAAELEGHPSSAQIIASWPGPHTWLLPNSRYSAWVSGAHNTVGCRVPGHAQARALCAAVQQPLVSTSANRAGEVPALTEADVTAWFGETVDFVLSGEVCNPGAPSTIYDLAGQVIRP